MLLWHMLQVADGYVPPTPTEREPSEEPMAASPEPQSTSEWESGCIVEIDFAAQPKLDFKQIKAQLGDYDKGVRFVEMQTVSSISACHEVADGSSPVHSGGVTAWRTHGLSWVLCCC